MGLPAPRDDNELALHLEWYFGLSYPRSAVCAGHSAPYQALADAYFARHPVVVIHASRGFGGKSTLLAGLSLMELCRGACVTVLGGSSHQSRRVHEVSAAAWNYTRDVDGVLVGAPRHLLERDPSMYETRLASGNWMRALTASMTSVRGPHPQRLRLDEVDEMDIGLLDSALGQPMASGGIPSQTVISSTQQYANGTMAEVLRRASERGWPIYRWCYRETHARNGGWVTDGMIREAQERVTSRMWSVEYELGDIETEGAAFAPEVLAAVFQGPMVDDAPGRLYTFEPREPGGKYVTAADWARDVDYTVIVTLRYDVSPARVVAYERTRREPWPAMVDRFNRRLEAYPGQATHDATGVGAVVDDYLAQRALAVTITAPMRRTLYSSYTAALEHHLVALPRLRSLYYEHRTCTYEDLFGHGHTPDSVVAVALAWSVAAGKVRTPTLTRLLHVVRF